MQRGQPFRKRFVRSGAARGFTLYELLVSLAIGSGVMTSATGLFGLVQEQRAAAAVNELIGHLNLARSEAIHRGTEVVVCASVDSQACADAGTDHTSWNGGYLAYVDSNDNGEFDAADTALRVVAGVGGELNVKTSKHRTKITFQPSGLAAGSTITFAFCDRRGASGARYVTVQNGGRARVSRMTTSSVQCT